MKIGESLTIIRRGGYRINYIKPCTMEKGKKMAKIRLENPPAELFEKLKSRAFDDLKAFPELGMAKIRLGKKQILVFRNGDITIRMAEDEQDVLQTAEMLINILKTK